MGVRTDFFQVRQSLVWDFPYKTILVSFEIKKVA